MPHLIQVGNSRGICIPQTLIEQAELEEKELEFVVVADGLLIKPVHNRPRQGWEKQIREALQDYGKVEIDSEWLNASLTDDPIW